MNMKVITEDGEVSERAYSPDLLAFEHEGRLVRNPYLSGCGRFAVDPEVHYGFRSVRTPNGFALEREHPEGGRLLLMTVDGCAIPDIELWPEACILREDGRGSTALSLLSDIPEASCEEPVMDYAASYDAGPN